MAGRFFTTVLLILLVAACNEPVQFIDEAEDAQDSSNNGNNGNNGEEVGNNGDPVDVPEDVPDPDVPDGTTVTILCEPSEEEYAMIYTSVDQNCGTPNCHGNRISDGQLYVPAGDPPDRLMDSFNSALAVAGEGGCEDPEASPLLMVARQAEGTVHPIDTRSTEGYRNLRAWLENGLMRIVEEPDAGPDAPDADAGEEVGEQRPFPCDGLPTREGLPNSYPFDACPEDATLPCATFVEHINPVLLQQCALADCHADQGNGFFLLTDDDECAPAWNYFSTYWYIDHADPPESPLLVRPLVDDPQDPHTGLGSLGSRSSCEHISILKWLNPQEYPNWQPCDDE